MADGSSRELDHNDDDELDELLDSECFKFVEVTLAGVYFILTRL